VFGKITLLLFVPLLGMAQAQEPLFGTWRLTSGSGPSVYARVTCKIQPWQDGLRVIYDMVGNRGGVTHWEWTGKLDGEDYSLEGIEEAVTDAYIRLDDHTYRVVLKVDGRPSTTSTISISSDGRTMTVVSSSSNTAVYTKR
jgi:hypothetical protein